MAAVLVALYEDYDTAERVRTQLVSDGFPTDRVELTSSREPGQAGSMPGESHGERFQKYFATLFEEGSGGRYAHYFAERVAKGQHAITIHPRGDEEFERGQQLLERHNPLELEVQGRDETEFEHARADDEETIIGRVFRATTRSEKRPGQ
jgi:hypothetical protein